MKKILKISILIIILISVLGFLHSTYAIDNPNIYKPEPSNETNTIEEPLRDISGIVIGVIRSIGTIISVGILMFIGVKTMIGSVEEKSKYKEVLPGYIIGAVLIFAITLLPQVIYNFSKNL